MTETWKEIPDMNGYLASNKGRIRSTLSSEEGKILETRYDKDGYLMVWTKYNNAARVHRLIASAFLENKENHPVVHHKDNNKENNCVENLEWCSISYNTQKAYDDGLLVSGASKGIGVFYEDALICITNSFNQLSEILFLSRNAISDNLYNQTPVYDELYLREIEGDHRESPLYKKQIISEKPIRYQTKPIEWNGQHFVSIQALADHLGLNRGPVNWALKKERELNGFVPHFITRYEYYRI